MDGFGRYSGQQEASPERYPLKWHRFLIWFSLWAGAIVSVTGGWQTLTGEQYLGQADAVYAQFGSGLKTADMVYGVAMILLGAYMIYTRYQLAGFRIGAPKKLSAVYIAQVVLNLLMAVVYSAASGLPAGSFMESALGNIVLALIMLFANQNYYSKRMELFVN